MSSSDPGLGQLLAELQAATIGRLNVGLPATVVTFDPATQTITAKPTISARYHDPVTDALVPAPIPAIANVPVAFPSAAGFAITWPLTPGDTVFLVFADRSMDEWKATGLTETVPVDVRRLDLTDAVAIPGLRPFTAPIPATGWAAGAMVLEGVDIRLGSSVASSPVALQPPLSAFFTALLSWLGTHTHADPASGFTGVPVQAGALPSPGTIGATRVKAV